MPVTWTDFEACVYERIAYYRLQYDQATRIYHKLLKQNNTPEQQLLDILNFQQAMLDELSRSRRLLLKYTPGKVVIPETIVVQIEPVRLN